MDIAIKQAASWKRMPWLGAMLATLLYAAGTESFAAQPPGSGARELPAAPTGPYRSVPQPGQRQMGGPQPSAPKPPAGYWNRQQQGPGSRGQAPQSYRQGGQQPRRGMPNVGQGRQSPQWGGQAPQRPEWAQQPPQRPEWSQQRPQRPAFERPEPPQRPDWSRNRPEPPRHMQRPNWPDRSGPQWQQRRSNPWQGRPRGSQQVPERGAGPQYRGQPYPPAYGQGGYPAPPASQPRGNQ